MCSARSGCAAFRRFVGFSVLARVDVVTRPGDVDETSRSDGYAAGCLRANGCARTAETALDGAPSDPVEAGQADGRQKEHDSRQPVSILPGSRIDVLYRSCHEQ
jgi:hypothetical protein